MIRMLSSSGRPALMPRTMVSTASGNASRNFASRRFFRNLSSQSGMPKPAANAMASAAQMPGVDQDEQQERAEAERDADEV